MNACPLCIAVKNSTGRACSSVDDWAPIVCRCLSEAQQNECPYRVIYRGNE